MVEFIKCFEQRSWRALDVSDPRALDHSQTSHHPKAMLLSPLSCQKPPPEAPVLPPHWVVWQVTPWVYGADERDTRNGFCCITCLIVFQSNLFLFYDFVEHLLCSFDCSHLLVPGQMLSKQLHMIIECCLDPMMHPCVIYLPGLCLLSLSSFHMYWLCVCVSVFIHLSFFALSVSLFTCKAVCLVLVLLFSLSLSPPFTLRVRL